jgi:hypothetical protein
LFIAPYTLSLAIMVKILMSSITMAMVAADDETSLLQMFAGVRKSQGQRILAAVTEEGNDTICVQAAAGDVAPVTGSFTARMSQQAMVVAAGSVAGEAGSFCVAKQDVLLIQRTFGLNTARDFEAALGSKNNKATTTTTTMDHATFDFAGNLTKKVSVKAGECPSVEAGLVQTVEASVSDKKQEPVEKKLDADQLRVCGCRNFLMSTVEARPIVDMTLLKDILHERGIQAGAAPACPSCVSARTGGEASLTRTCTDWSAAASWTVIAKTLNEPSGHVQGPFKAYNITGGWQHCDKSWVVQGACSDYLIRHEQA